MEPGKKLWPTNFFTVHNKNIDKGVSVLTRIRVPVEIVTPNSEASPDFPKRASMLKGGD